MHLLQRVQRRNEIHLPELRRRVGTAATSGEARVNYRHAYHAGNFADVVKHLALVAILLHLRKKESPFAVIDTHAGRGLYDLGGTQARKTAEARGGIEKLRGLAGNAALGRYLEIV